MVALLDSIDFPSLYRNLVSAITLQVKPTCRHVGQGYQVSGFVENLALFKVV